jgi:hypothetical protein
MRHRVETSSRQRVYLWYVIGRKKGEGAIADPMLLPLGKAAESLSGSSLTAHMSQNQDR